MIFDRSLLITLGLDPDEFRKLNEQEQKKKAKKAYHSKAQEYHPDKWDEMNSEITYEEQTSLFKDVVHAYKMITDSSYRDGMRNKDHQVTLHAVMSIDLTFEQAFFGMKTTITFNPTHLDEKGKPIDVDYEKDVCLEIDVVKVIVPRDTRHSDRIVFRGLGMKQEERRGDLIFVLNVHPHPSMQYDFDTRTFMFNKSIDLETMLGGGEVEVETMFGLSTVRIPAGSRPNDILLKKHIGTDKSYNIEVTIQTEYPDKKKLKGSSFWDKLKINWGKEEDLDEEILNAEEEYEKAFERLGGWKDSSVPQGAPSGFRFDPHGSKDS